MSRIILLVLLALSSAAAAQDMFRGGSGTATLPPDLYDAAEPAPDLRKYLSPDGRFIDTCRYWREHPDASTVMYGQPDRFPPGQIGQTQSFNGQPAPYVRCAVNPCPPNGYICWRNPAKPTTLTTQIQATLEAQGCEAEPNGDIYCRKDRMPRPGPPSPTLSSALVKSVCRVIGTGISCDPAPKPGAGRPGPGNEAFAGRDDPCKRTPANRFPTPMHLRLYREPWLRNPLLLSALRKAGAKFQPNKLDPHRKMSFDAFSITITAMPPGLTPEQFLNDLASDPNGTVDGSGLYGSIFDRTARFRRRHPGTPPKLGEIYDIDIPGDSGSVQLVEKTAGHFIFETVTTPQLGTHPVDGARQFGFYRNGSQIVFYTQGAERAHIEMLRYPGRVAQNANWIAFMKAIGETINRYGGRADLNSVDAPPAEEVDCD